MIIYNERAGKPSIGVIHLSIYYITCNLRAAGELGDQAALLIIFMEVERSLAARL